MPDEKPAESLPRQSIAAKIDDLNSRIEQFEQKVRERYADSDAYVESRIALVHKRLDNDAARFVKRERAASASLSGYFSTLWSAIKGRKMVPLDVA